MGFISFDNSTDELYDYVCLAKRARDAYYNGEAIMKDSEWDELMAKIKKMDPRNPIFDETGNDVRDKNAKITLFRPMGSLDKILMEVDKSGNLIGDGFGSMYPWFLKFQNDLIYVSHKYDGLAIEISYQHGRLKHISTRGNGYIGSDVTNVLRESDAIPETIKTTDPVIFRGEACLSKSKYAKYLEQHSEEIGSVKSYRNIAAGAVNRDVANDITKNCLLFVCYAVYCNELAIPTVDASAAFCNMVVPNNIFTYASQYTVTIDTFPSVMKRLMDESNTLDFQTDGLVFTINNRNKIESLGYIGNSLKPKAMVAFKFCPDDATSEIVNIIWQPGRTGRITPVAVLRPVELDGTIVSKCSLHNINSIVNEYKCAIGSTITIHKCGEIIPQIKSNITPLDREFIMPRINYPSVCPCCGVETYDDGINIFCKNPDCTSKVINLINHYIKTLNIKNIGVSVIERLIDAGKLTKVSDLYSLSAEDIMSAERMGTRSAEIILEEIKKVEDVKLHVFLAAMGIKNFGLENCKLIVKKYKSLQTILKLSAEQISTIDGLGDICANSFIDWINTLKNLVEINKIAEYINVIEPSETVNNNTTVGNPFHMKNVCCTGSLKEFKRDDIKNYVEVNGGSYTSIKKGLDYLIIGDGAVQDKIDKAKSLGAQILTEEQYKELITSTTILSW